MLKIVVVTILQILILRQLPFAILFVIYLINVIQVLIKLTKDKENFDWQEIKYCKVAKNMPDVYSNSYIIIVGNFTRFQYIFYRKICKKNNWNPSYLGFIIFSLSYHIKINPRWIKHNIIMFWALLSFDNKKFLDYHNSYIKKYNNDFLDGNCVFKDFYKKKK